MFSCLLRLGLLFSLLHLAVGRHQLVVLSFDGFRHDYLSLFPNETRFLRQLIPKGVHVGQMVATFPTSTYPNHWTIATGLYQESHGIVGNNMFDPEFKDTFKKTTNDEKWWNASLPIWIEAKRQGLKSATFFWPGSEVKFQGLRQDHYFEYNDSYSYEFRVETVLQWVTQDGINLVALSLGEPDYSGHGYKLSSSEVRAAVQKADDTVRSLFEGLEQRNYSDKVNVLVVSDHGMTETRSNMIINLTNSLDPYVARILRSGALLIADAKPGRKQALIDFLKAEAQAKKLLMRVYAKENLPRRYHYSNNRRIGEVLVLPDQGYLVLTNRDEKLLPGTHGYDNSYPDMMVPMFAVGPSFRKNVQLRDIRQVDIYGIMCHLLDIRPQPNNGSLWMLPHMVK